MSKKPTILLIGDSAALPTGMGVAVRKLGLFLHSLGKYNIKSFGWYYSPDILWDLPWEQAQTHDLSRPYGHPLNWPEINGIAPSKKDIENSGGYKIVEQFQPDLVIGIADIWMLDWITALPNKSCFKLIWEFPIDGTPMPKGWCNVVKNADIPVVMTEFAKNELLKVDERIPITKIPRGIDLNEFYKINYDKESLRKEIIPAVSKKFSVGIFGRFQERKQIDRGLEAYAKFLSLGNKTDCMLYLHMDVNDPASIQSKKTLMGRDGYIEQYGLMGKVCHDARLKVNKGVSPQRLNALYNCMDITILPTQGEGWGLPVVESMACGTPVVATDYTSLPELLSGHGLLAKPAAYIGGMYNVKRAIVDTDHMAELMNEYYIDTNLRKKHSEESIRFVRQFEWGRIGRKWEQLIDDVLYKEPVFINKKVHKPKHITIYGAVFENTGFSIVTRGFAESLSSLGAKVKIQEGGGRIPGFKVSNKILELLENRVLNDFSIINHMPQIIAKDIDLIDSQFRIAYFPWELTKLPSNVVESINRKTDGCWCNSTFLAKIYEENGINKDLISVIPNGVTTNINTKPALLKTNKSYKFLYIGNLGDVRKNVRALIRAYLQTFTADDDVCLVLKSLPGYAHSDPTEIIESEHTGLYNTPEILVVHEDIEDLSGLYAACDCYVHVSHAEGWGQPIAESLSMGLHVIAPEYGGYMDFAKDKIIPVDFRECLSSSSPVHIPRARWIDLDFNSLKFKIREVYDRNLKRRNENLVPELTWGNSAKKIIEKLETISVSRKHKLKVYFETGRHSLWNEDNEKGFKRYAPTNVEFTKKRNKADLQLVNITRLLDSDFIYSKNYVALMHTFGEWAEEDHALYNSLFKNAKLVYSHLNLSAEFPGINFMRGAWGVDVNDFYRDKSIKRAFQIVTTGEIAETEGIGELVSACEKLKVPIAHVGRNIGSRYQGYMVFNNLSKIEMRNMYNSSYFTNGLRRIEGFEKPVIEGLLCGSRPICFDTEVYRYWYGDIPEYIAENSFDRAVSEIVDVFKKPYRPVTEQEERLFLDKFDWKNVSKKFWERALESV